MIAITAATGNIGHHLAQKLAQASIPARLLVRELGKADTFGGKLEAIAANLDHPQTLAAALSGITQLFLLSPGPDTPGQDVAAIAAAQQAGVRHIVLLSSLGVELGGIGGGRPHAPGEELLRQSGLEWTILRPSEFMTNTLWWLPEIKARGSISVPSGSGAVGFIDPADIAAVAFTVLTQSPQAGKTYRLTGPEALSTAEVAALYGAVLGKPVRHNDISDADYRSSAKQAQMPQAMIEMLSEYNAALKEGRMNVLTADVQQVTGRAPTRFADWVRANLESGGA
ncbi:MAG: SDR family oxidoreductase [Thermaceae bacterium]|nr:SDR family oxidoreductase [Thermaceae bacterium]